MTQLERRRILYDQFEPWVLSEALTRHDLAVAVALADICGEDDQHLILALAFAVAAPQSGHTAVDLREIREHTLASYFRTRNGRIRQRGRQRQCVCRLPRLWEA